MFQLHLQALTSLKKYPLPLSSGQEAKILDHIGMQPLPALGLGACTDTQEPILID